MSAPARFAVAALAAMLCAGAADAADPLAALFPPSEPVCYAARFDATQLAAHPDQSVVTIRLMRGYPSLRESDETAADGVAGAPAQLIVTFRDAGQNGAPRQFGAEVSCRADGGAVRCGIACDGGDFVATRDDAGDVHVAITESRTLRIAGGCTNHRAYRGLGDHPGDRAFTLARQPMDACR